MKNLRGYVSSREFMDESCHQSTQNLVLRDYCERMNFRYLLSGTEYAIKNSYLVLQKIVDEVSSLNGIVAYSLFQMPENYKKRVHYFEKIIENNGEIHFALENLKISNYSDISRVNHIWLIRQTLKDCITNTHIGVAGNEKI